MATRSLDLWLFKVRVNPARKTGDLITLPLGVVWQTMSRRWVEAPWAATLTRAAAIADTLPPAVRMTPR